MISKYGVLALVLGASSLGAQAFEGNVTMSVTGDNGRTTTISYMLKGGKMRFDPAGPNGAPVSIILDPATRHMMVIMSAQKMYMERDFPAPAAMQPPPGGKTPTVVRTGKMETIAGYKCEHVTISDDDGTTADACISNELGGFRMPSASNPMAPQREPGWATSLGSGAFPLRVSKNGKTIEEVTAIEKKSLDPALFEAPAGYQAFSMPQMPKRP